ncbi:hypothetical protein PoB_006814800 [Plakobranchus ocellatus]|uniref:Mutator-like transposase domain-containing protein n=1 Tax=Plakobranchus ocellatus TaxID=259542 RepID=A0AAV4DBQ3_9GAST|nr:hypothetical protein PoB_006814800 [Plakobranchus ocellatus]
MWAKWGHTSKIGAGAVIEVMIGLVINFQLVNSRKNSGEYKKRLQSHQESGLCTSNYEGSSDGMEVRGALTIGHWSMACAIPPSTWMGTPKPLLP